MTFHDDDNGDGDDDDDDDADDDDHDDVFLPSWIWRQAGLGLVALRLGPEEMAAQVSYLEGGKNPLQDIGLPSEFRSSYSSCSLEAKSFPWFRKGRRVSQKAKHEI